MKTITLRKTFFRKKKRHSWNVGDAVAFHDAYLYLCVKHDFYA